MPHGNAHNVFWSVFSHLSRCWRFSKASITSSGIHFFVYQAILLITMTENRSSNCFQTGHQALLLFTRGSSDEKIQSRIKQTAWWPLWCTTIREICPILVWKWLRNPSHSRKWSTKKIWQCFREDHKNRCSRIDKSSFFWVSVDHFCRQSSPTLSQINMMQKFVKWLAWNSFLSFNHQLILLNQACYTDSRWEYEVDHSLLLRKMLPMHPPSKFVMLISLNESHHVFHRTWTRIPCPSLLISIRLGTFETKYRRHRYHRNKFYWGEGSSNQSRYFPVFCLDCFWKWCILATSFHSSNIHGEPRLFPRI